MAALSDQEKGCILENKISVLTIQLPVHSDGDASGRVYGLQQPVYILRQKLVIICFSLSHFCDLF